MTTKKKVLIAIIAALMAVGVSVAAFNAAGGVEAKEASLPLQLDS